MNKTRATVRCASHPSKSLFACSEQFQITHPLYGLPAHAGPFFPRQADTEVKIDGEELLIIKESDIMGVLEGSKASRKAA